MNKIWSRTTNCVPKFRATNPPGPDHWRSACLSGGLMMSTCTIMDETCYNCLPRAVSPSPANESRRKDISRKGERGRIAGWGGGRGRAVCCNCDCGCPACLLGWLRSRRACLDSGLRRKSYVLPKPYHSQLVVPCHGSEPQTIMIELRAARLCNHFV